MLRGIKDRLVLKGIDVSLGNNFVWRIYLLYGSLASEFFAFQVECRCFFISFCRGIIIGEFLFYDLS